MKGGLKVKSFDRMIEPGRLEIEPPFLFELESLFQLYGTEKSAIEFDAY